MLRTRLGDGEPRHHLHHDNFGGLRRNENEKDLSMSILNRRLLLSAALAGVMGVAPAAAGTAADQEEMRAMMRAWILDEPEIIVEAMRILEARERASASERAEAAISEHRDALSSVETPGYGAADATVTIVKFSDYRCGFCQSTHGALAEIVALNPDVRVLVREFPVLGEDSEMAARLALAVWRLGGEDAYKQVHDMLFAASGALSLELRTRIVSETGRDMAALEAEMRSPEVAATLEETMALARALEVQGTPALVIGDSFHGGAMDAAALARAIEGERP